MVYVVSGALLFGYSGQLPHYLLEACATRLVGTGGYGSGILLRGVTVIHIANTGDFTSQGGNVFQYLSGIHTT